MKKNIIETNLRANILKLVNNFVRVQKSREKFIPGKSRIHFGARIYDQKEVVRLVNASLDFWITLGKEGREFETNFAKFMNRKRCVVVNSGSSADLLAVAGLCAKTFPNRMLPGDEVITTAMAFPTTVAAILHNNLIPVFIDIELDTYNIDANKLEAAISKKTRAIILAHTLGNPAEMDKIVKIAKKHKLYLIEDICDALDSRYGGKLCGTFGDVAAAGFYPAHHMMMGEGGAVVMDDLELFKSCRSLRDWGREDLGFDMGKTNSIEELSKRFSSNISSLPKGYDRKYIYTNIGYNLKPTDLQCAIGIEQLRKVPAFTLMRKKNFKTLYEVLKPYKKFLILPRSFSKSDPSWFAFPITVCRNSPFSRKEIMEFLESNNIETRVLFAGNILKHPGYRDIKHRTPFNLNNSNFVLSNTFFVGIYPGIGKSEMNYMIGVFQSFFNKK
ncbi:MAG: lipopolysaccharide biosynthesis protein RfbH [Candidatus Levybacteria bacterium RIFCSPHIGHO2_01_FULL_36_15]|nr:MAG: lipopolysaccharide biosynthesis protein RfbH [Candidatus Levybacteria bacterium RIFCSPHIGHO2_01_FULL_36_15]